MMTQFKAAFPLGLVCFPGEQQNLHIFEPRYKQLIKDIKSTKDTFIMVPFVKGKVYDYGTEVSLHAIHTEYPDGKFDLTIEGERRVKILKLTKRYKDKLYPGVKTEEVNWNINPSYELSEQINTYLIELYELLNIQNAPIPTASDMLVSKIIKKIGLTLEQELQLLSIQNESDRQKFVINHLKGFLPEVKKMRELQVKAALNGHFKNIDPSNF